MSDESADHAAADKPDAKRWHLSTAAIAGIIALASGAVSLVFTLAPSLTPDPGTTINASMKVLVVEPHATFGRLLKRLPASAAIQHSPEARTPEVRNAPGDIVYVGIEVDGRKRRKVELKYAIYSAASGRREEPRAGAFTALAFTSETPSDHWVATPFVPYPADLHKYFIRFELYDRDTILAIADSPALPPAD